MAEDPRPEDFAPFVGKPFQPLGVTQPLVLVTMETHEHAGLEAARREPFSLILRGPPKDVIAEGLYRFSVEGERTFELYLVPVHTVSRDHQDYQIAFN